MIRLILFSVVLTVSSLALAEPLPANFPNFPIEKTCALFLGHPRPLAFCQEVETRYRSEVRGSWDRTPEAGRERCAKLADQSERGKYEVLARCLRVEISEAAWREAVGSIKQVQK